VTKQFTLSKEERLKSRKLIDQVFSEGKRFTMTPFRIHYMFIERSSGSKVNLQVGAGVSARNFKRAVDRNRIRRLIREAWRLQKKPLQEKITANKKLAVFLLYTSAEIETYQLISEKVNKIISKLSLLATSPA